MAAVVEQILTSYDTITVVGASASPAKAASYVPAHMQAHGWRIIPVNPHASQILGEPVYRFRRRDIDAKAFDVMACGGQ